jgi:GNAT superfamily N-acetyltransferase
MSISVHPFTGRDLETTVEVVKAAYNVQYSQEQSLRIYLALQPGGSFVAKYEDAVCGFGGALDYGPFAYIGLMAVSPSMQKRGIGRLVLEEILNWLDARGCATVLLDASPAGAPLYDQCGFIGDDRTLVLQQKQHVELPRHLSGDVTLLHEEDLEELLAFDAPCFGAERQALLAMYRANNPGRTLLVRDSRGQITGYLTAQSRALGPWVARTPEAAERLLIHALTLPFDSEPNVFVSAQHSEALRLLSDYDFSYQRDLLHMRKGTLVQRGRLSTLYGQASLGFG